MTGGRRKKLVKAISEITGLPAVYKRIPTYAFEIGAFTVDKEGTLLCNDEVERGMLNQLTDGLTERVMEGWQLLFRGAHAGAVATVEHFEGGSVPVLVWEVTSTDEAALDRYEGWPYLYRKETVKVRLEGEIVQAMVYIMNEGRPLNQPSCHYYTTILEGYQDAGFDSEILRKATETETGMAY